MAKLYEHKNFEPVLYQVQKNEIGGHLGLKNCHLCSRVITYFMNYD